VPSFVSPWRGLENARLYFFSALRPGHTSALPRDHRRSRCAKTLRPTHFNGGPAERLAYAFLLSPDRSKQDTLTVVGVNRRSADRGKTVDRLDTP
jgi:hypothetical protein